VRLGRLALIIGLAAALATTVSAAGSDPRVGSGPALPGLQDAENEPAIAVDAGAAARGVPPDAQPLVVGANVYYDEPACGPAAAAAASRCTFFPGVGISGVYFSADGGTSWTGLDRLHYPGFTTRTGARAKQIVTVPRFAARLASHGDPALAFGPRPAGGTFVWTPGSRLYYAMLAQRFKAPDQGPQLVVVSRTDAWARAAKPDRQAWTAWMQPVIVSHRTSGDTFADKPAIWADNAASSRYLGSVYMCWASYRSAAQAESGGTRQPILFSRSTDGGATWSLPSRLAPGPGDVTRQGCAIRTDSNGGVYVVWEGSDGTASSIYLTRSFDGGATFEPTRPVAKVHDVGQADPVQRPRWTFDGVAGARTNSWPSIDIANGAPCAVPPSAKPGCQPAPNTIVLAWSDGTTGINTEKALVEYSTDLGVSWSEPIDVTASPPPPYAMERPDFPAVAISPNGQILYVVYTAFHDPWQSDPLKPRRMGGVFRAARFADVVERGRSAAWTEIRGAVGDASGTSSSGGEERSAGVGLAAEFIGDYNSVVATDRAGYAAWIDVASALPCPAVSAYRRSLSEGRRLKPPKLAQACPGAAGLAFGNSNLFGGVIKAEDVH
jgi:hypothetical protein